MRELQLATEDRMLKDSLRQARSRTRSPRLDPYVTDFDKGLLSGDDKIKACARILRSLREKFDRGTPQADLEEFWMLGLAITRAWFAEGCSKAIDPTDAAAVKSELCRLHLAEEHAQSAREEAEAALAHDHSPSNAQRFLEAQAAYVVADTVLRDFVRLHHVRRELVAAKRSTQAGRVRVVGCSASQGDRRVRG